MSTLSFELRLDRIVGGGQALGTAPDGKKVFVWGGLPGEIVWVDVSKKKSSYLEAVVSQITQASPERVTPRDPASYLSTSPWQIMTFASEQHYKAALIEEAFELHNVVLPGAIDVFSDGVEYGYRNKVEFSWFGHEVDGVETLDLAFFRRGSKGKVPVDDTSLARPEINQLAQQIRDMLRTKKVEARALKTLLIRANQAGQCAWQLYVKDANFKTISDDDAAGFGAQGGEVIYSDPKSPASRITKRLAKFGDVTLEDTIRGVPFRYATESFFQVNLPVYEQALEDMATWTPAAKGALQLDSRKTLDLYAGVGTIGLTIGGDTCTLVEIDEHAVREMRRNIKARGSSATAVLAPSEKALDEITSEKIVIVDPPRAGLHRDVVAKLLNEKPPRVVYLSCNPVTQARDIALLCSDGDYGIRAHRGYNFFPRTPHIEHLVVLDRKN